MVPYYKNFQTIRFRVIGMAILFTLDRVLAEKKMQSRELAEKAGCSEQTISKIKNGRIRAFRIETMDVLCRILECQPGDLLKFMDDDEARATYGDKFIDDYFAFLKG